MSKPWEIAPVSVEKAQLCIKAAEMRARSVPYGKIAAALGLASPLEARKCAERGFGLVPGEDVRMARRVSARRLDEVMAGLWETVANPGPVTGARGEVVCDPETRVPLPNELVRIAAYRAIVEADKEYKKLHGADAPRRQVTLNLGADDLQAEIERTRREVAEAEAEAARQAVADRYGGDGPRVLPSGA